MILRNIFIVFIIILVTFISCKNTNSANSNSEGRKPQLEVLGDRRWFHDKKTNQDYLLNSYLSDFSGQLEWPPDSLCNIVDISFDLSGSGFLKDINFNNEKMPLAKYNIQRLKSYLLTHDVIAHGSIFLLRLFGENKNGSSVRDECLIRYPKIELTLRGTILTRRFHDLQIHVDKVNYPSKNNEDFVNDICSWFLKHINAAQYVYNDSPILNHINTVISEFVQTESNVKKTFIFITDGWEELEDIKFWPRYYEKSTLEKLKNRIQVLSLKPFKKSYELVDVVLVGVNFGDNYEYKIAQKELFEWFFEPQKVTILYY